MARSDRFGGGRGAGWGVPKNAVNTSVYAWLRHPWLRTFSERPIPLPGVRTDGDGISRILEWAAISVLIKTNSMLAKVGFR
jgi:hypothetical protein